MCILSIKIKTKRVSHTCRVLRVHANGKLHFHLCIIINITDICVCLVHPNSVMFMPYKILLDFFNICEKSVL